MKKTKVYIQGRNSRGMYIGYTWFQVLAYKVKRFFRITFRIAVIVSIVWGIAEAYRYVHPNTVTAEVTKEVAIDPAYPVLERIAKAESYNSHYCTAELVKLKACKSSEMGQVLMKANTNGSVDVGKYAINNTAWGAKAAELGYNITDEQDNKEMALWIYRNYGTEPWYSSKHKW